MFRYVVDESRLPLVIFESPGSIPAREIDMDSFYAEIDRFLALRKPFATLHDLRGQAPDANRRKRFTSFIESRFEAMAQRLVAHAVVIDSSIQANVLTAVLWIIRSPCPMKVFSDRAEAEAWLASEVNAREARGRP